MTEHGAAAVEPGRCRDKRRGGSFFERLEAYHKRRGTEGSGERWPEAFDDPAFSRQVLGLEDDDRAADVATP